MSEKSDGFPLLKYLDGLVDELRRLSAAALAENGVEAVHDARVATRRLKAAVDLMKPVISGGHHKPFNKITRVLRRRLGEMRDLDVMLEHLGEVRSARHAPSVAWLKSRLEESRRQALARAAEDLPPSHVLPRLASWSGLRQEIIAAEEAVESVLAESIHGQLDEFAASAQRLVEQVKGNDPHEVRIAGKSLRYTLEMARIQGVRLPKRVLGGFKRIQTALGLWHDLVVLTERALSESVEAQLALHDAECEKSLLSLAAATFARSRRQLAKVVELWNQDGPALTKHIREALPLTVTDVEEPKQPALEPQRISISSTSNTSVELGGIGPAPAAP
jgi:CHAD domain-containing protein